MSASEAVSPTQFFHGSSHWFKPGEQVDPTPDRIYGGHEKAFSTPNIKAAGNFAHGSVNRGGKDGRKSQPVQGALFAPVYEVEPIDPEPALLGGGVVSRKGLKIKGVAAYSRTDNLADDASYQKREFL